ncbi:DUF4157 domain-containing protein [Undibacterium sp. Di26W]|uniref:eCIS core domain-containing protein n=1 Tax=Undibacterium sp. Di26W TaxID=3413035 RepID=UPI003BF34025
MSEHIHQTRNNTDSAVGNTLNMGEAKRQQENTAQLSKEGPASITSGFVDRRPQMAVQKQLQDTGNNSPQARQLKAYSHMMQNSPRAAQLRAVQAMMHTPLIPRADDGTLQTKSAGEGITQLAAPATHQSQANDTGLPNQLKAGIESLSGISMDHVKVNYNSDKPAQLNAHAYAQGSEIHVAPGQEHHVPHEAWHVVQQAQGRVRPTMQMKQGDVPVNNDRSLEQEADTMGAMALQHGAATNATAGVTIAQSYSKPVAAVDQAMVRGAVAQRFPAANQLDTSQIKKSWIDEVNKVNSSIDSAETLLQALKDAKNIQELRDWGWPGHIVEEIKIAIQDIGVIFFEERQEKIDKNPDEMIKLRRRNSLEFIKFGSEEIQDFRKDKVKNSIPIDFKSKNKKPRKMTLQGRGYFAKGGSSYDIEIEEIKKDVKGKDDEEKNEKVNMMLLEGIKDEKKSFQNVKQESILSIVNLSETARSSNNLLDITYALENNPKEDTSKIFRDHTVFGPAKEKSKKQKEKLSDEDLERHERWAKKVGGSQGSQFHKIPSMERKMKREGKKFPLYPNIVNVNRNRHEVLKNRYREKSPELMPEEFELDLNRNIFGNNKEFISKRKRSIQDDDKIVKKKK